MKRIDIKEVLKNKAPNVKLPSLVIWLFRRIIHENELNKGLEICGDARGIEFARKVLDDVLMIRREVDGFDDIPDGNYIFAANHPLGGLDGLAILDVVDTRFSGVRAIANDLLMNVEQVNELFLPINKHGRQSSDYARILQEHFSSGKAVMTFPAGFCSRKIDGEIKDIKWNYNYIKKALEYKRDIVPIYVDEMNSKLFYNIEVWRKRLGIKFNIGMILLPHELFRKKRKGNRVRLIFGEPVTYEQLSGEHNINYWNAEIRRRCYALKGKN